MLLTDSEGPDCIGMQCHSHVFQDLSAHNFPITDIKVSLTDIKMTRPFLRSQLPDRFQAAGYLADNGSVSSVSLVSSCL